MRYPDIGQPSCGPDAIPPRFRARCNQGEGASPEELLVSVVTACYNGTLLAILHRRGRPAREVQVRARVFVTGYPDQADFSRPIVSPTVAGGDPSRLEEYRAPASTARDECFIGHAVRDHLSYEVDEGPIGPLEQGCGGVSRNELPKAGAGEGDERFFKCPHCVAEIDRLQLCTFWNEWGLACYCPRCGSWDSECGAFPI